MIEVEYTKQIDGKTFSLFYSGGYTWTAWLEGTGNIAVNWNAEDTLADAEKKLNTKIDISSLDYRKY